MKTNPVKIALSYLLLVLIALAVMYPCAWIVMSSFKAGDSLYSETFIPQQLTLDHYRELFDEDNKYQIYYPTWYWNTLKIAFTSMVLGTIIQLLTAYSISRFRFAGRKQAMTTILVLGMFPGFMSLIAIYILLQQLNLLGSWWALVLVYSAGAALGMFVAKGFFDTIPRSLEEAARIDGAGHFTIFWRIMLPLSRPIITYISLTTFTGAWVDFIFARMVLRNDRETWTLAVGLFELVQGLQSTKFTLFAAGAILVAIPITILFMFLQRFLVDGLTAGASKG